LHERYVIWAAKRSDFGLQDIHSFSGIAQTFIFLEKPFWNVPQYKQHKPIPIHERDLNKITQAALFIFFSGHQQKVNDNFISKQRLYSKMNSGLPDCANFYLKSRFATVKYVDNLKMEPCDVLYIVGWPRPGDKCGVLRELMFLLLNKNIVCVYYLFIYQMSNMYKVKVYIYIR
jgi:hypothetical protein